MKEEKNLFRHLKQFGSRIKASVVRPICGNMPDLALEAPTCTTGIQVFFRHGKVGSLILQLRLIVQLFALAVRMFSGMNKHNHIEKILRPRSRYLFFKIRAVPDDLRDVGGVDQIDLKYPIGCPVT